MKRPINSPGVYRPNALFAHAIAVDGGTLVCSSGVLARDPATGRILHPGDARQQTEACLGTLEAVLQAAGGTLDSIVKMTVFLRHAQDYDAMNAARRSRLAGCDYASSTVIAGLVAEDALVEIEVMAVVPADRGRA
ncbi:RidA family protein [Inquilinus sp.]|jgi:2-iminobutanoate/2-iminopropanoate deaminase|uniref:RidA family protein n=1 Tax=Inquilinus sp. TaxID=1932117 RepID=UPI003782F931